MTLARGTDHIESERLILRRITPDDLAFYTRIHGDPSVARYLGNGRPRTAEESSAWLDLVLFSYEELGLGALAVVRKSDGALIGRCGLNDLAIEAEPAVGATPKAWFGRRSAPAGIKLVYEQELGYTFDPSAWGAGYASESARRVFVYAKEVLRLPRIISLIHPQNVRSKRVAGRFGVQIETPVEMQSTVFERYRWPDQGH
jgi:ribosomal-protein-alanine N-acetyltransferase